MRARRWGAACLLTAWLASGVLPSVARAGEGAWVFTEHRVIVPTPDVLRGYGAELAGGPGGFTFKHTVAEGADGLGKPGTQVCAFGWTAPPSMLTPGQKVRMTLTGRMVQGGPPHFGNFNRAMSALFMPGHIGPEETWQGFGWRAGEGGFANAKGERAVYLYGTDPSGTSRTIEGETTVPGSGTGGGKMHLTVGIGYAVVPAGVVYNYAWSPAGTGAKAVPHTPLPDFPAVPGPGPAPGPGPTPGPGPAPGPTPGPGPTTVTPGPTTVTPPMDEPASVTRMTLQAAKRKAKAGETVTAPIWLLKGAGLIDMNFSLEYDPTVVQVVGSVVKGNLLEGADFEANAGKPGLVQVGFVPKTGGVAASDGTVAQITFKVVGQPGSRTTLRLVPRKASLAGGAPANPATIDGEVQIVDDAGLVPGDINGDGKVGMDDVMLALKISVELLPHNARADVDKDGQVTAADARLIRDRVLGIRG